MSERPSMGRIVHYAGAVGTAPAIVSEVIAGDTCDLTVFPASGPEVHTDVPYADPPQPHTWRWPPRV